jgi:hypothetical protein
MANAPGSKLGGEEDACTSKFFLLDFNDHLLGKRREHCRLRAIDCYQDLNN